jgi:hypothetical protein
LRHNALGSHPPRIASKLWRELIKKVWDVDPLIGSHCGAEMKVIALLDDPAVTEKIRRRRLELWPEQAEPACLSRAPPQPPPPGGLDRVIEPLFDDPLLLRLRP